jgi:hypothetical protein
LCGRARGPDRGRCRCQDGRDGGTAGGGAAARSPPEWQAREEREGFKNYNVINCCGKSKLTKKGRHLMRGPGATGRGLGLASWGGVGGCVRMCGADESEFPRGGGELKLETKS